MVTAHLPESGMEDFHEFVQALALALGEDSQEAGDGAVVLGHDRLLPKRLRV